MLESQVNSGVLASVCLVSGPSLLLKGEEEGKRERRDPSSHLSQAMQKSLREPETMKIRVK